MSGEGDWAKGTPSHRDFLRAGLGQHHQWHPVSQWLLWPGLAIAVVLALLLVPAIANLGFGSTFELMSTSVAPSTHPEHITSGYLAAIAGYLLVPAVIGAVVGFLTQKSIERRTLSPEQVDDRIGKMLEEIGKEAAS